MTGDGVVGDTETTLFVRLMEPHVNPSTVLTSGEETSCLSRRGDSPYAPPRRISQQYLYKRARGLLALSGAACLSLSTSRRPDHSPPKEASGRESWRRGRAREAGWDSSRQAASLPESEASKSARLERRERVSGGQVGTRGGREGTSTPWGALTQAHLGAFTHQHPYNPRTSIHTYARASQTGRKGHWKGQWRRTRSRTRRTMIFPTIPSPWSKPVGTAACGTAACLLLRHCLLSRHCLTVSPLASLPHRAVTAVCSLSLKGAEC